MSIIGSMVSMFQIAIISRLSSWNLQRGISQLTKQASGQEPWYTDSWPLADASLLR